MSLYSQGTKISYKSGHSHIYSGEAFTLAKIGPNQFTWLNNQFNRRCDKPIMGSDKAYEHGITIEQIKEEFGDLHSLLINGVPAIPDICPTCHREF